MTDYLDCGERILAQYFQHTINKVFVVNLFLLNTFKIFVINNFDTLLSLKD